jgi:hypothetical protein
MQKIRTEIDRVKRHRLEYYSSHIDLVENYIEEKPDISIETCKALIEGISKLTLFLLNQEPLESHNKTKFHELFRSALKALQQGRGFSDTELVRRMGGVVHEIGELRNSHCDIGHGRASLKEQINDADYADLIIGMTDNLCAYMLRRLDQLVEPELLYEDNEDFNRYLDELYPLDGFILYSKALFDQQFLDYEVQLSDYQIENES